MATDADQFYCDYKLSQYNLLKAFDFVDIAAARTQVAESQHQFALNVLQQRFVHAVDPHSLVHKPLETVTCKIMQTHNRLKISFFLLTCATTHIKCN